MILVDGALGEGGGQVLRTSLALSVVTGKPFRIERIRAGRKKPGLLHQHLTAVHAAARIGAARLTGAELGSGQVTFEPGEVLPGHYRFDVGTAGSATLVLQTILPALILAEGPSDLVLEGGTHNPGAPPFDFLVRTFLPLLNRMGPRVKAALDRPGFYPAGGGAFHVHVTPARSLSPLVLEDRGEIVSKRVCVKIAGLPRSIAERELEVVARKLSLRPGDVAIEEIRDSRGPGNVVSIEIQSDHVTEIFTGFGARGVPAETVAGSAADEALSYLATGVPVGAHLADQLLVPIALAGRGAFRTLSLSLHSTTNIEVIRKFMDVRIDSAGEGESAVRVSAG